MFGRKKKVNPEVSYDSANQRAVVQCSICTGEQVAGFKDMHTGKFTEVMLIRDSKELDAFMKMYGLTAVSKEY